MECRAGTILFEHSPGVDGGTVQIFSLFWLCCSGYGTVEMVGGGLFSFQFLWFAVVRLSVVGFCFSILVFLGYILVLYAVSYLISC